MSSRIFSAVALVLLASCGGPPEGVAPDGNALATGGGTPADAPVEHIACAVGDAGFTNACTIDRTTMAEGSLLTIRHPDGGFHRLRMSPDGGTITAADGALPAQVTARSETLVEVATGDARYRLPLPR